jgi:hypothetical protein
MNIFTHVVLSDKSTNNDNTCSNIYYFNYSKLDELYDFIEKWDIETYKNTHKFIRLTCFSPPSEEEEEEKLIKFYRVVKRFELTFKNKRLEIIGDKNNFWYENLKCFNSRENEFIYSYNIETSNGNLVNQLCLSKPLVDKRFPSIKSFSSYDVTRVKLVPLLRIPKQNNQFLLLSQTFGEEMLIKFSSPPNDFNESEYFLFRIIYDRIKLSRPRMLSSLELDFDIKEYGKFSLLSSHPGPFILLYEMNNNVYYAKYCNDPRLTNQQIQQQILKPQRQILSTDIPEYLKSIR